MAARQIRQVLYHLRRAVSDEPTGTDGQLLERFISGNDEVAFASLVRRHGPMVWGVCCRLLRSHQDAEDAFQATFLVLVRKAASIASRQLLANWLYGVAQRTALKARTAAARRHVREKQVTEMPDVEAVQRDLWDDLQPLLDQELSNLPEKYRVPILLCDLEGKTRKQAARQLGVPEGTVAGRLARARALLARRLARHGLPLSAVALAAMLASRAASAAVPTTVVSATVKTAILAASGQAAAAGAISAQVTALAEGVLKTMLLAKLKIVTPLLLTLSVVGLTAGLLSYGAPSKQPARPETRPQDGLALLALKRLPADLERLQGTWTVKQADHNGKHQANEDLTGSDQVWQIAADRITIRYRDGTAKEIIYHLAPDKTPKAVDVTIRAEGDYRYLGIYALEGDTLKFAYSRNTHPMAERPTAFDSPTFLEDRGRRHFVLRRLKSADAETPEKKQAASKKNDWTLDFKVRSSKTIKVDLPGRGERTVWYVRYELSNNSAEPVRFVPEFQSWSDKQAALLRDQLILTAQERIRAAEDPAGKLNLKNSVSISRDPIGPGKKLQGIALWDGIDPAASKFTMYVRGLSNGYFVENEKSTYFKTLEMHFQRLGEEMRPIGGGEWVYRRRPQ